MQLSIAEAAALLGKSVRQVRYMIDMGRIPARKVGGRWVIRKDALPRSVGQRKAQERRRERLRDAVDDALESPRRTPKKRFSFRDLRAVQLMLPIYEGTRELGEDHPSTLALRMSLEHLCRGCHRYQRGDKAQAYRAGRDEASRAACALALCDTGPAHDLLTRIEDEVMPALASCAVAPAVDEDSPISAGLGYPTLLSFGRPRDPANGRGVATAERPADA